jgi:hypothetical protein
MEYMTNKNTQSHLQDEINIESDADLLTWRPSDRLLVSLPRRSRKVAAVMARPAVAAAPAPAGPVAKASKSPAGPAAVATQAASANNLAQLLRNSEAKQQQAAKAKALEDETLLDAAAKHRAKAPASAGPAKKRGTKKVAPTTVAEVAPTTVPEVAATTEEANPKKDKPTKGPKTTFGKLAPTAKATKGPKKTTGGKKRKGRKSAPLNPAAAAEPLSDAAESLSDAEPTASSDEHSATPVGDTPAGLVSEITSGPRAFVETLSGASGDDAGFQRTPRTSFLDKLSFFVDPGIWTSGNTRINHFSRISFGHLC